MVDEPRFEEFDSISSTQQDVVLRYAVAKEQAYEHDIVEETPLRVEVRSHAQPAVVVTPDADSEWCTCDEDAVPGTCTHVLYLAVSSDEAIAQKIRATLSQNSQFHSATIEELRSELRARKQEKNAIAEALNLLDGRSES